MVNSEGGVMITINPSVRIGLCCVDCRASLETKPAEPSRGGKSYDWVVPVETCVRCQKEQFEKALDHIKKEK